MKPYPGRKKLLALFLLAFTLKLLTVIFLRYLLSCAPLGYHLDELVIRGHDYFSYHAAMENYIQTGAYYFFNGKENVYAGRLPHFSFLYLFFRQFLNVAFADLMVLLVQLSAEAIAIVVLSFLAYRVIGNRTGFYLTYILCLLSWAISFYSMIVLPDSLSVSLLVFFAYCFYSYLNKPSARLLLLSGLFLGLVTVLKPHLGLLYLVVGFYFLRDFNFTKAKFKLVSRKTLLVALPLLIMLAPWIIRNYQIYHRFIPFTVTLIAGYNYTEADLACRRFLQSFGEDFLFWDEKSAGHYFKTCQNNCTYKLPDYVYTTRYGQAEIEKVRQQYQELQQNFSEEQDQQVAAAFNQLTNSYQQERPFRYQVVARLISTWHFVYDAATYYLPIRETSACFRKYQFIFKYLQWVLFWSSLLIGLTGLVLMAKKNGNNLLFLIIPLYLLLFFSIILRWTEGRYFIHSYPFLLLGLVYMAHRLQIKFLPKNSASHPL